MRPRLPALFTLALLAACNGTSSSDDADARAPDDSSITRDDSSSSDGGSEATIDGGVPSGPGATSSFSYPNGFASASGDIHLVTGTPAFSGSALEITSGAPGMHEAGAAWYKTQQDISSFTTQFTFQLADTGEVPESIGMTFCVQNSNTTTNPTDQYGIHSGNDAASDVNLWGYGGFDSFGQHGIGNSVAIKFDVGSNSQQTYPAGGAASATGLYINGGPSAALVPDNDLNPSGVHLNLGHVMAATIVYDGSILTLVLEDTTTNAQYRTSWPVDIPAAIKGNSAWVGFTAGELSADINKVLTWSFSEGYAKRLPLPIFSVASGSYPAAKSVSISAYPSATIYYTTNGQPPTTSSQKYSGPITISASAIVQAVAVETGYTDSLVATANYQIAPAGTPLINFPAGFATASAFLSVNGAAKLSGGSLDLTDGTTTQDSSAAWYAVPVGVHEFTTDFTLQLNAGGNRDGDGMMFVIQNQPPTSSDASILYVSGGPNALANGGTGFGYSGSTGTGGQIAGLLSSVAVKLDLTSGSGDTTGLYTNGADTTLNSIDMTSSGLNLNSGNPLAVKLVYDGTTLKMTITDTETKASFSNNWSINIPATVGGGTAYVGFTGGTGYAAALQQVQSWTYAN